MRYKRPDTKNALSILEAAEKDMKFTLSLQPTDESGSTIVRNIYECFRMMGDALLIKQGIESEDHLMPINEIMKINIETSRPLNIIDNLRRLRHNINYYGYKPNIEEVKDAISIAQNIFSPLLNKVKKKMDE